MELIKKTLRGNIYITKIFTFPLLCKYLHNKGHIESHVNIIYREVYAHMRNQTFYSLDALNSRILELLEQLNHKKMQGHDYSRYERFIREEKPLLRALPGEPYVFRYSKGFTVNSTYHVQLVADRHFYSVQ